MCGTHRLRALIPLLTVFLCASIGCHSMQTNAPLVEAPARQADETPRELYKATLPEYRIEPPDILAIDAVRLLPGPDYKLHIQDVVTVSVFVSAETPLFNIDPAEFVVGIDGTVDLGPTYGTVAVAGMSIQEAKAAVEKAVGSQVKEAIVSFRVSGLPTLQPIAGEHLVGPDGMINLGSYGSVSVVGMTINEARKAIERHLSQFLTDPQMAVNVFAYNSKKYYVITEGAGLGDTVTPFPDHRQRDGAGRDCQRQRPDRSVVEENLDRAADQRSVQGPDPAGRLARHHGSRGDRDQLPADAW